MRGFVPAQRGTFGETKGPRRAGAKPGRIKSLNPFGIRRGNLT